MQYRFPHEVIYETPDIVPVSDVIDSLLGTERVAQELGPFLESCIKGLKVESVELGVQEISQQSPLRELFFLTLLVTFQDDLSEEVPGMLERIFGVQIGDEYNTFITVCVLILFFYGADYVYRRFHDTPKSKHIKGQLDGLITDVAKILGCPDRKIRKVLEDRYGGPKVKTLARSAMRFFKPSKHQRNAPMRVSGRKIQKLTLAEIPAEVTDDILSLDDTSNFLSDVELEIHAQDVDRAERGWAAVIPGHVDRRVRMMLFPPVTPEQIYTKERLRGDVVVVSTRQDDGELKPSMIHLLKITE